MIPERISIRGFLCYRETQEVHFEGCSLWMLAGPNGSGKSALFDALTFALYGQHRAGKYNARELINKRCDSLVIAIDFRLDQALFRARRTLDRAGRPTRQLYERTASAGENEETCWQEIPDTHTEQGFDRWIREHVGLTYDMFTASVLLLQGKADNLLQVGPAERHSRLAQIVGLERYQQLQSQAEQHWSEAHGAVQHLHKQLAGLPTVRCEELRDAQQAAESATTESRSLALTIEQLTHCLGDAERWQKLRDQQALLQKQLAHLGRALAREPEIEREYRRWEYLESHLDDLLEWSRHRRAQQDAQAELNRLRQRQQDCQQEQLALDQRIGAAYEALRAAEEELEKLSVTDQQLAEQQPQLVLARSSLGRLQQERKRLDRQEFEAAVLQQRLDRLVRLRDRLAASVQSQAAVLAAHDALAAARDACLRQRTVRDLAEERGQRFGSIAAQPSCPYCQQPLSSDYARQVQQTLEQDRADAQQLCQQAEVELLAAQEHLAACERLVQRRRIWLERVAVWAQRQAAALDAARHSAVASCQLCAETWAELPDHARPPLGNSGSQGPDDLQLTEQLANLDRQLADQQRRRGQLAHDADRLRTEIRRLRSRRDTESTGRHALQEELARLVERAAQVSGRCIYHERMCQERQEHLPAEWRDAGTQDVSGFVADLQRERTALTDRNIAGEYRVLQTARSELEQRMLESRSVDESLERIPSEARRTPREIQDLLDQSRRHRDVAEQAQRTAVGQAGVLEERLRQRRSLTVELEEAERQQHLWRRLVTLLGRDGLQFYLLERAEQAIVEHANAILDRLAAGQVHVQVRDQQRRKGAARQALDLVAFTATSGPRLQDIAFLSGSQRFRLAVALSLAIGQYASRTRRPVQAVIIDEGFGCLDAINRQVMIQELQNLRSQLQRIVLVSHQEEFISAFADGYQCELVDGATRLTRFHR